MHLILYPKRNISKGAISILLENATGILLYFNRSEVLLKQAIDTHPSTESVQLRFLLPKDVDVVQTILLQTHKCEKVADDGI